MAGKYAPRDPESRNLKSKFVSVAFDPKRRFALEIAARKDLRTVSNVIGVAVDEHMEKVVFDRHNLNISLHILLPSLWSPDPSECFVKTAWLLPGLLTFDEQLLWERIKATGEFWKMSGMREGGVLTEPLTDARFNFAALREQWETLKAETEAIAEKEQKEFINGFPLRGGREVRAVEVVATKAMTKRRKK